MRRPGRPTVLLGSVAWKLLLVFGGWLSARSANAQTYPDLSGMRPPVASDSIPVARPATPVLAASVDPTMYRLGSGEVLSLEFGGRSPGSQALILEREARLRLPRPRLA